MFSEQRNVGLTEVWKKKIQEITTVTHRDKCVVTTWHKLPFWRLNISLFVGPSVYSPMSTDFCQPFRFRSFKYWVLIHSFGRPLHSRKEETYVLPLVMLFIWSWRWIMVLLVNLGFKHLSRKAAHWGHGNRDLTSEKKRIRLEGEMPEHAFFTCSIVGKIILMDGFLNSWLVVQPPHCQVTPYYCVYIHI